MKYPRTPYLPFSPGLGDNKDKSMSIKDVENFLNINIIITEKLDGSNTCLKNSSVYARSHSSPTICSSFDAIKSRYKSILHKIPKNISIYGENLFAIHSLEYTNLTDYFFVFSMYYDNEFLCWDDVYKLSEYLKLSTVPVLKTGIFTDINDLKNYLEYEMSLPSSFGGEKEGIVIRTEHSIEIHDFQKSVAKYVRKNHVTTDEHWSRNWKKANINMKNIISRSEALEISK